MKSVRDGVMERGLGERREGETSLRSMRLEVCHESRQRTGCVRETRVSSSRVPFFLAPIILPRVC